MHRKAAERQLEFAELLHTIVCLASSSGGDDDAPCAAAIVVWFRNRKRNIIVKVPPVYNVMLVGCGSAFAPTYIAWHESKQGFPALSHWDAAGREVLLSEARLLLLSGLIEILQIKFLLFHMFEMLFVLTGNIRALEHTLWVVAKGSSGTKRERLVAERE